MILDKIDTLYRDYQLTNRNLPDLLVMDIYHYLELKEALGLDFLEEIDYYHGMSIRVEEGIETRLENYESYESMDDFYISE
jgi:hypothetical protein